MKKRVLFFCLLALIVLLVASTSDTQKTESNINQDLQKIAKKVSENGWVYFKDNFKVDPKKFFSAYKKEFKLSENDEMRLVEEGTDSIFKFYKFKRYYKGILVESYGYTLKYKNDNLELAIGKIIDNINIDVRNIISPENALKVALENTGADKFAWEDSKWESSIRKENKDSSATWLPEGKLVITRTKDGQFRLAYSFKILSIKPEIDHSVQYIDAQTGNFIKEKSLINEATSPGIVYYYGPKTFTTYYTSGHWRLQDRTRGIITAKINYYWQWWDSYGYLNDWDNNWDWPEERPAVSALWAAEKTYDYFHVNHSRHGTDNNNKELRLTTEWPYINAAYWPDLSPYWDAITIGYFYDISYSFTALDIIGHEYTHAIVSHTANLDYVPDESGALNESFSDFFGECVENSVYPPNDWLIGADMGIGALRSMSSPNDFPYYDPDYYQGDYWYYGADTSTYVHTNSGVPNKMFYLLTSDIGYYYTSHIALSALSWYLDEDANFSEAREAFLNAALGYGNECYYVYGAVMDAWAAVGIGEPSSDPCFNVSDINFNPDPPNCEQYNYISVDVSGGSGNYSYEWYIDYELVSTSSSFWYWFPETFGYFYIQLYVSDGEETRYRESYTYPDCGGYLMSQSDTILLSVYPNPVTDLTTLEISENNTSMTDQGNTDYNISIVDNNGRILFSTITKSNKLNINMLGYQKGSYLLVVTKGKHKGTVQIIKK